jgi:hypothetical protein
MTNDISENDDAFSFQDSRVCHDAIQGTTMMVQGHSPDAISGDTVWTAGIVVAIIDPE